jgi:hypothetical protein
MTICPMCGNFTDNKNCEVCGIKLFNDDSDKDPQELDRKKPYKVDARNTFHIKTENPTERWRDSYRKI